MGKVKCYDCGAWYQKDEGCSCKTEPAPLPEKEVIVVQPQDESLFNTTKSPTETLIDMDRIEYRPMISRKNCVSKSKSLWKGQFKIITYSDSLSKEEATLFDDDPVLESLWNKRQKIEDEIIHHINKRVQEHRSINI